MKRETFELLMDILCAVLIIGMPMYLPWLIYWLYGVTGR